MSLSFNGVFGPRDAGSLVPAQKFNKIIVSNCIIGGLRLDRGHDEIRKDRIDQGVTIEPITPNPENLPVTATGNDWSLNTEFFATFNGNLEAGPLSFYGKDIDSIIVRRTSNRKAYSEWEDLKLIDNVKQKIDENFNYIFDDKSVESGVVYMYGIQPISKNQKGSLYKGMVSSVFYDDIHLVGEGGRQLTVRYNPAISSIRTIKKEARVETIGSQYPYITRNGNVSYKEFPLSGTITYFMDPTESFAPRAELFIEDELAGIVENVDMTNIYNDLYHSSGRADGNNEVLEREFRDKAIKFLQDGKPKLFKSPTEGVMIVRLMDINVTPNQQLGRMICDFSCTAVEVDKYSLDNLNKYGIQER